MFRSYEYYIYVSGIELVQMFKQNKLSNKQKKKFIKYILNYKSYKIQMLDILKIKIKIKKKYLISYKVKWIIDDVIINDSNYTNNSLICNLIKPVVGA